MSAPPKPNVPGSKSGKNGSASLASCTTSSRTCDAVAIVGWMAGWSVIGAWRMMTRDS